jgi:3-hydroxyisobutyrate dehydrogenase-like beta-hydroxyacid dehydrogenase
MTKLTMGFIELDKMGAGMCANIQQAGVALKVVQHYAKKIVPVGAPQTLPVH